MARNRAARDRTRARLGDDLSDGAALQHRHFAGDAEEGSYVADRRLGHETPLAELRFRAVSGARLRDRGSDIVATKKEALPVYLHATRSGTAAT